LNRAYKANQTNTYEKKTITLFTVLLFAGMMLPACGVTIEKRQHTRGYYVNTNPRQHVSAGEAFCFSTPFTCALISSF